MIDIRTENLKLCLEKICRVKPGQNLLIVADDSARPMSLARDIADLASSMGIEAVMSIMKARTHVGEEPPRAIAAAMKAADVILQIFEKSDLAHTDARAEATKAGVPRIVLMPADISEDYLQKPISLEDLNKIKERTDKLAGILHNGNMVKLTTLSGTDLTLSIKGRPGRNLHPLTDYAIIVAPDSAEASIAPVEGTTEGVMVIDVGIEGWGYLLRKPIRFEVKKGRVQLETISSDIPEHAERVKRMFSLDQNANNCAAELGIGTSHTINMLQGSLMDAGMAGVVHIACGRNNDFGGETWSQAHQDCLMTGVTMEIDGVYIIEKGELKV